MSGTAKEAERARALRKRAAEGDAQAAEELTHGENTPDRTVTEPHDPGQSGLPPAKP